MTGKGQTDRPAARAPQAAKPLPHRRWAWWGRAVSFDHLVGAHENDSGIFQSNCSSGRAIDEEAAALFEDAIATFDEFFFGDPNW